MRGLCRLLRNDHVPLARVEYLAHAYPKIINTPEYMTTFGDCMQYVFIRPNTIQTM